MGMNETMWERAQRSVIGSALIDPDFIPTMLAETSDRDYSDAYLVWYQAIRALNAEAVPIDVVTIVDKLGSPQYRSVALDLMKETPTSANAGEYVRICHEQSRLTALQALGYELGRSVDLTEARKVVEAAAAATMDSKDNKAIPIIDSFTALYDRLNSGETPEYMECGIACLDHTIHTVPGNMHIVAGYTSHGKSALAIQMAWHMAKKYRVGYFRYETTEDEFVARLASHAGHVKLKHIKSGHLSNEEFSRTAAAGSETTKRNLLTFNAAGWTVDDIRVQSICNGLQVIFVDYIQKVKSTERKWGRTQEVSDISDSLQQMGQRYGITVFALSQLSRPQKSNDEFVPAPGLPDLRDSGQIEQDADAVIFVHAPYRKAYPNFRMINIEKNRQGNLDSFYADFRGEFQTFCEPSEAQTESWDRLLRSKRKSNAPMPTSSSFSNMKAADDDNPFTQSELPL